MTETNTFAVYEVTLFFKYPAWDEKNGIIMGEWIKRSKAEAIRSARHEAANAGHTVGVGRYWFRAVKLFDAN
jgi:hypothetical protein